MFEMGKNTIGETERESTGEDWEIWEMGNKRECMYRKRWVYWVTQYKENK